MCTSLNQTTILGGNVQGTRLIGTSGDKDFMQQKITVLLSAFDTIFIWVVDVIPYLSLVEGKTAISSGNISVLKKFCQLNVYLKTTYK
jgi:hypothetical protein